MNQEISNRQYNYMSSVERKIKDIIFLFIISILTQGFFVSSIGFYSDDWFFLNILSNANDKSIIGLIQTFFDKEPMLLVRPIQAVQISILYWLFDKNPLGYHIINSLIFIIGIVLFYLILAKLKLQHAIAVGIPLVYSLLPHYSTARIWMSCFSTNLSIAFLFLNLYSGLRYVSINKPSVYNKLWLILSAISLSFSILSYEIVIPVFLLNFFIVWLKLNRDSREGIQKLYIFIIINSALYISCIVYKVNITDRIGGFGSSYIDYVLGTLKAIIKNDYITYGIKLPIITWKMIQFYSSIKLKIISTILFLIIFIYFLKIENINIQKTTWLKLIIIGIAVYIAGYAVFLTTAQIQVTPAGLSNRIATAAAIGVSICLVGIIGLSCLLIEQYNIRNIIFCFFIASLGFCGHLINCTIASFYSASYTEQLKILENIYANAPKLKAHNTVILDGIHPYIGPAPVFECYWDISSALQMHYHKAIRADVRRKNLHYNKLGVTTSIYGEDIFYPFNDNLIIFNARNNKYHILNNFTKADTYFTKFPSNKNTYSEGEPGYGITIF